MVRDALHAQGHDGQLTGADHHAQGAAGHHGDLTTADNCAESRAGTDGCDGQLTEPCHAMSRQPRSTQRRELGLRLSSFADWSTTRVFFAWMPASVLWNCKCSAANRSLLSCFGEGKLLPSFLFQGQGRFATVALVTRVFSR